VTTPTYIVILVALLGWLIVPRINDALTKRRERENKRLDFVRFLKRWRTEVELFRHPTHIGIGGSHPVEIGYREKMPDFISEIERARSAFGGGQFDALTKKLAGLTNEDFKQANPRDIILEAIDALIEFCAEQPENS
jgi:hypothetical protein